MLLRELVAAPSIPVAWGERLAPGEVIGRFELVRELGRGGFGVVFEARDRELGRSVAFKAVSPGTPARAGEQLLREAEAIARLSHPNLVTLFDAGRCELGPFLVLELLRGRTLRERIEQGPLPLDEALEVATAVARGLAHAHEAGVIHRDLKPSNVFLCEGGAVKVLDFGMAYAFGRQRVSGGTPAYMAPEQWRDAPEDERTDVFTLGVLVHEMLTGKLPFDGRGQDFAAGKSAPDLPAPAPPALAALVAAMLELDPGRRPRTAEVLSRLEAIAAERARPAQLAHRRSRWVAAVAAAALLGAAAAGVLLNRPTPPAADPPSVAVLPFQSLSTAPDDPFFADGIHGELITQLGRVAGLRVIARGSVQQYAPGRLDLRRIADALGVTAVLEGTVQRDGGRARITVWLVDPRTGTQLWADRFDRSVADVFQIQTEVALEIAAALGATLTHAERQAVAKPPTLDREAHDLFLRGLYYWDRSMGVESDNRTAEDLVSRAAARDPAFALAHAWLASMATEWRHDCVAARAAAARAVALDPQLPEVHMALGQIREGCEDDPAGAIREYETALRAAPGSAKLHQLLGGVRTTVGQLEAGLDELRRGFALAPRSLVAAAELTKELAYARRFDEATQLCPRLQELAPGDIHGLVLCALIPFWKTGDLGPARRAVAALPLELPSSGAGAWSLFQLLAVSPEETLRLADQGRISDPFASHPFIPRAFLLGTVHAARGEAAAAGAAFSEASVALEAHVRANPEEFFARAFLARARAGAGQGELGLQEIQAAIARAEAPSSRAAALRFEAEIAAAIGNVDLAVAALRRVLQMPGGLITPASVRADPRYAPLRGDRRFEALLEEPAVNHRG